MTRAERIADPTGQAILAMIREYAERHAIAEATGSVGCVDEVVALDDTRAHLANALWHYAADRSWEKALTMPARNNGKTGFEVAAALAELKRRIGATADDKSA